MEIIWTERAKRRMREIFDYLDEAAGKRTARKIRGKIEARAAILAANPQAGQREELLAARPQEFRYLVEGNYKIIYRLDSDKAVISTVFDCRQNPEKMKEEVAEKK